MDVRDLDAMYYRRYIKFVRNFFLRPGDETRISGELADRFTGVGDGYLYDFVTGLERRFLALSSVRYVLSTSEVGADTSVVNKVIDQHRAENLWGFGLGDFPIAGGETAFGIFQHPPSHRLSFKTVIDATEPVLEGVAAIKTEAQEKSDGVGFLLEIKSADKIEPLFSTLLNPKNVAQDRAGRPFHVDLSRYAGQHVELLFSTDPGPSGNNAYDWAGMGEAALCAHRYKSTSGSPFQEFTIRSPYLRIFSSLAACVPVLWRRDCAGRRGPRSAEGSHIRSRTAGLLSAESLPEGQTRDPQNIRHGSPAPPRNAGARIVSYNSQHVEIETQSDAPAILMLNDANYPGWRVSVNGKPAPILQADYLFRGVIVPAGRASVEFDYAPASFRVGASISARQPDCSHRSALRPTRLASRSNCGLAARRDARHRIGHRQRTGGPFLPVEQAAVERSFVTSQRRNGRMSNLDDLDVVIRRKNGKILASIPQLGLYAKGENAEAALATLDAKKKELAAELEETGELDILEIDNRPAAPRRDVTASTSDDLGRFAIKTGVVALFIGAALTISAAIVGSEIEQAINNVKSVKIGGAQFSNNMEAELDRLASPVNDLPEVKKQKLLADIRAIAVKWHPFVAEIRSALASPDDPPERPALMKDK